MRKILIITCAFFLIVIAFVLFKCGKNSLENRVVEFQLENGMKWFLVKRGYAPVFAGVIQVKVGGADEEIGKTGLAHMLEHMAFKGTSKIGTKNFEAEKIIMDKIDKSAKAGEREEVELLVEEQKKYIVHNEIWDIMIRNGATNLNASTSKDVTTYHAEMPSSKLELWIYLLSEMISDPAFREFYRERDVVLEEQLMSIDNNPKGRLYKSLGMLAFEDSPYRWPTIGTKEDVLSFNRQDLREFYDKHYLPECMVGAIVGDVNIEETKKYLTEYFGKLKGGNGICHRTSPIDPPQNNIKSSTIFFDAEPMLLIGFHKPTVPHFDDYIFDIFSTLLCEGESSRLIKRLVKEKRIAKSIACFNSYPGTRLPNLFVIYAEPYSVETLDGLRDSILLELEKLKSEPINEGEMKRVKNQMKTGFLMELDSNYELAQMLVYFENIADSWHYILNHPANIDKITYEDIMKSATEYFVPTNSTEIRLRRKEAGK